MNETPEEIARKAEIAIEWAVSHAAESSEDIHAVVQSIILAAMNQAPGTVAVCLKCGGFELVGSDDCRSCGENFNELRPATGREIVEALAK